MSNIPLNGVVKHNEKLLSEMPALGYHPTWGTSQYLDVLINDNTVACKSTDGENLWLLTVQDSHPEVVVTIIKGDTETIKKWVTDELASHMLNVDWI